VGMAIPTEGFRTHSTMSEHELLGMLAGRAQHFTDGWQFVIYCA